MNRTRPAAEPLSLVVVGGGPRGNGLVERLVANAPELLGDRPLVVHVVEPFDPGAGRIWRAAQSPLLWANSQAEDMTMFTDASCAIAGPIVPGPTFQEWAGVPGMTFPTRRTVTEYLTWSFRRAVHSAPETLEVRVHPDVAVDVLDTPDGRQRVVLRGGETLAADVVLLAQGHLPTQALGASATIEPVARRHGLTYLPEAYTADADLSALPPGRDVIVRGAGLAFVDLFVLLFEGRGGRYVDDPAAPGGLRYEASGAEPRLFVGSRRGVPYRSKLTYRRVGPTPPHPRFLTPTAVDELLAGDDEVDFRREVWPLLVKELAFGHYHELFRGHPERTLVPWAAFEPQLGAHDWDSPELTAAVAAAVPRREDRFDPVALDRPLAGVRLPDSAAVQQHLVAHVLADLERRGDPDFSADLGVFDALLAVFEPLGRILGSGRLSTTSIVTDVAWFVGFFSYVASGPPPRRLRELLALTTAGHVQFLGADVEVRVQPVDGAAVPDAPDGPAVFVARSPSVPGEVAATALVEARVPRASVGGTADVLLAALGRRGAVVDQVLPAAADGLEIPTGRLLVTPDTSQVVDADGRAHPARFAFGSGTSAATPGAFSRPNTNAAFFRQNDRGVRTALAYLASLESVSLESVSAESAREATVVVGSPASRQAS